LNTAAATATAAAPKRLSTTTRYKQHYPHKQASMPTTDFATKFA
jgi:hypothetical protein